MQLNVYQCTYSTIDLKSFTFPLCEISCSDTPPFHYKIETEVKIKATYRRSSINKINGINIQGIYTPQITSQNSLLPLFVKLSRVFHAKPPHTTYQNKRNEKVSVCWHESQGRFQYLGKNRARQKLVYFLINTMHRIQIVNEQERRYPNPTPTSETCLCFDQLLNVFQHFM